MSKKTRESRDDKWALVEDVCQHLSVSRDTIYKWIKEKGLPAYRIGKQWRFKLHEVDEWMQRREVNPAPTGAYAFQAPGFGAKGGVAAPATLIDAGLDTRQIEALQQHWITTVEAFVAACNIPEGRTGIRTMLDIDDGRLEGLLQRAIALLPETQRPPAAKPAGPKPLGVLPKEDEKTTDDGQEP